MKLEFEEQSKEFPMGFSGVQNVGGGGGVTEEQVQGMIDKSISELSERVDNELSRIEKKFDLEMEQQGHTISGKADKSDTYTKKEVDDAINNAIGVVLGGES